MEYFNYNLYLKIRQKRIEKKLKVSQLEIPILNHPDIGKYVEDSLSGEFGLVKAITMNWQHLEGYYTSAVIVFPNLKQIKVFWSPGCDFLSDEFKYEIFKNRKRFIIKEKDSNKKKGAFMKNIMILFLFGLATTVGSFARNAPIESSNSIPFSIDNTDKANATSSAEKKLKEANSDAGGSAQSYEKRQNKKLKKWKKQKKEKMRPDLDAI